MQDPFGAAGVPAVKAYIYTMYWSLALAPVQRLQCGKDVMTDNPNVASL